MKIERHREDRTVLVSPSGRLDGAGAPALEAELCDAARLGDRVVLDGRSLDYISSAGLRALLIGAKSCVQEGGDLAVAALQPECRAVVEASGLLSVLDYHETREAALAAPSRSRGPEAGEAKLEIGERREEGVVVLSLVGRLDGVGAAVLMECISAAIGRGAVRVVLDCEGMSYVNSAGLRSLLIGAKACREEGGALVIAALAPQCRSVMAMSGFLSVLDCRETREEALAASSGR